MKTPLAAGLSRPIVVQMIIVYRYSFTKDRNRMGRVASEDNLVKEWAIVGAGPAGCHLAISLLAARQTDLNGLVLLDSREPLSLWKQRTANCGMTFLRSSSVHHIGVSTAALSRFGKRTLQQSEKWTGKVGSPSLELFNSHCSHLCQRYSLRSLWSKARVTRLSRMGQTYRLFTDDGTLDARRVVLALGPLWSRRLPGWLEVARDRTDFLLDPDFRPHQIPGGQRLAVLGGGMTSVQTALTLCRKNPVTLLTRSPIKVREFDIGPGWMGPVNRSFLAQTPESRRQLITRNRIPGTVNQRIHAGLRSALAKGHLSHRILESPQSSLSSRTVAIHDQGESLLFDRVLVGTGFQTGLHPLHQTIADELKAPLSRCGTPLLSPQLEWLPGMFVVGCHAELTLGPAAGNLVGTRLAAEKILQLSATPGVSS